MYLKIEGKKLRLNTLRQRRPILEHLICGRLGAMAIEQVRRRDIVRLCDEVEVASGPTAGDKAFAVIGKLLRWHAARSDDYVPPLVRGMRKKTKSERERVLSDAEITAIWRACGACPDVFARLVMFLLVTGQRRDEVGRMTWEEIAGDTWVIPASRYKTGLAHAVLLTAAARRLIEAAPHRTDFVFSNNGGKTPIGGHSRLKAALDKAAGVGGPKGTSEHWQLHDLRRTTRSLMSRAGIARDIAERAVGHKVGTPVERIYDRHTYADEKARALQALAGIIERIVNPQNNVMLFEATSAA